MEAQRVWVDFKLIKSAVTMEMLLIQYGIADLVRAGDEVRAACPIHRGKSKRDLAVNLTKNTFCCFSPACRARGNVLDFVAKMERCTVRDAALKLAEWFKISEAEVGESEARDPERPPARDGQSVATLVAEIGLHLAQATHHTAEAHAKFSTLKGRLAALANSLPE